MIAGFKRNSLVNKQDQFTHKQTEILGLYTMHIGDLVQLYTCKLVLLCNKTPQTFLKKEHKGRGKI